MVIRSIAAGQAMFWSTVINTLRPKQNGRYFPNDTLKCSSLNQNVSIWIKISFKFVPKGPINNISALVQIKAWYRSGASHVLDQWC